MQISAIKGLPENYGCIPKSVLTRNIDNRQVGMAQHKSIADKWVGLWIAKQFSNMGVVLYVQQS